MQNENKELIDKAINRFMCVYDADATSGLFTKRLEDLLEHFLNAKNDYVDYIIFFFYLESIEKNDISYQNIFKPASVLNVKFKIIISTNVGETGVTFPNIKYIIDTGFHRSMEYNCDFDIHTFKKIPITYFSAQQRKGRVGREMPGIFYGMYTRKTMENLKKILSNRFYTDDITNEVLYFIDKLDILYNELIYPPCIFSIWRSVEKLYLLGFITSDFKITKLGEILKNLSFLSVELVKMILAGYIWKAPIIDLITIAAYSKSNGNNKTVHKKTEFFYESQCELLPFVEEFYNNNGEHYVNTSKALLIRDNIIDGLIKCGLNPYKYYDGAFPNHDEYYLKKMKQCIYEGFRLKCLTWTGSNYRSETGFIYNAIKKCYPKYITYTGIKINDNNGNTFISVVGESVMDGFVNINTDFI
mgnify:CR=1 FL=1